MKAVIKTDAIDETVHHIKSGVHEAIDKAADVTSQATGALSQKGEQLMRMEKRFVRECRGQIHENPVTALSIAVGVVIGVGFLLSRALQNR